jgi:hypothetical protein
VSAVGKKKISFRVLAPVLKLVLKDTIGITPPDLTLGTI